MQPNRPFTFEVCVESAESIAACVGIADRIELCSGLDIGGLTPSAGLMDSARASGLETHVLIRPQSGDFTFGKADIDVALHDIAQVRSYGLHGVVIGATKGGRLDDETLRELLAASDGMTKTLHRAFDVLDDLDQGLEAAIDLGFDRILTSGGAISAFEGRGRLDDLHSKADGRIEIMAGAGVNSTTLQTLLAETKLTSFHASCTIKKATDGTVSGMGFGEHRRRLDSNELSMIRDHLASFTKHDR